MTNTVLAFLLVIGLDMTVRPGMAQTQDAAHNDTMAITTGIIDGLQKLFPGGKESPSISWGEMSFGEPTNGKHEVTLKEIFVDEPNGTALGIDEMRFSVEALDGDTYGFEAVLPTRAVWVGEGGTAIATAAIAGTSLSGVWSRKFNTLLTLDLKIEEIDITANGQPPKLTLANIDATLDLKDGGENRYTGPGRVAVGDLVLLDVNEEPVASFNAVALETIFSRIDLARANALATQAELLKAIGDPLTLLDIVTKGSPLVNGVSVGLTAGHLMGNRPTDGAMAMVNDVRLMLKADGLDGDQTSFAMGYGYSGLITDPAPGPSDVQPGAMSLDMSVATIPTAVLGTTVHSVVDVFFGKGQATAEAIAIAERGLEAVTKTFQAVKARAD